MTLTIDFVLGILPCNRSPQISREFFEVSAKSRARIPGILALPTATHLNRSLHFFTYVSTKRFLLCFIHDDMKAVFQMCDRVPQLKVPHMKHTGKILLVLTLGIIASAGASDLNDFVGKYGAQNGSGFMQPLADAFGADINSGLYQTAHIEKGFHIAISIIAMSAPIGDDRKTFTASTDGNFNPRTTVQAPTLFGSSNGVTVDGAAGTAYVFPGGLNFKLFPIAVPQLTVGSVSGTEVTARFFQAKLGESVGQLSLWGIGARHNISQYLPRFPLEFAVGVYRQHFEIGDIVSANATFISGQASYKAGVLTLYGGPGYEISTMGIHYDGSSGKVDLDLSSSNSVRFTIGANLTLAFFRMFADYNLASQSAFVLGIGFGF